MRPATTVSDKALNVAPDEAKKMAQETGQSIICHEPGYYTVGKTIFIDVRTYKSDNGTYNLDEIYNNPNNTFTTSSTSGNVIAPNGANPPKTSSVWDWSEGSYTGDFKVKVKVYTNYRFTGYSSYYTDVFVGDDGYTNTSGAFTVTAIQDNNGEGASWSGGKGTYRANIVFSGCNPSERLAFAISKPNDGGQATGSITVSHP
jgi:hypothetical protein